MNTYPAVIHIPHASRAIPKRFLDIFKLSAEELDAELLRMTDAHTDELFCCRGTAAVIFPWSRLLVDVERFRDDKQEAMSKWGMGVLYRRTADGKPLKRRLSMEEKDDMLALYDQHHAHLTREVGSALEQTGRALIIDGHSFPDQPQPCNWSQRTPRPDFCIGTDVAHTPSALTELAVKNLEVKGFSVWRNDPFAGTIVPMKYYQNDRRVASIMIEVNRRLYMDETTGLKTPAFPAVKQVICSLLDAVMHDFQGQK